MLKIENLSLNIENAPVLENVSFECEAGSITVITGKNGSGKTTLLSLLMGIHSAQKGTIFLNGKNVTNKNITQRAKEGFSLAFQHPTLFKGLTVQNLLEIANPQAKKLDKACEFLSQVGLCARDYLQREFNASLSGGERKRIELAISLAGGKLVCLFDEPESGIDMWSFDKLIDLFGSLKKQGKIVIIVSHNTKILEIADQILVLGDGKIVQQGQKEQVLRFVNDPFCAKLGQVGGEI